ARGRSSQAARPELHSRGIPGPRTRSRLFAADEGLLSGKRVRSYKFVLKSAVDRSDIHPDGLAALPTIGKGPVLIAEPEIFVLKDGVVAPAVRRCTAGGVSAPAAAVANVVCRTEPVGTRGTRGPRCVRASAVAGSDLGRVVGALVLAIRRAVHIRVDVGHT